MMHSYSKYLGCVQPGELQKDENPRDLGNERPNKIQYAEVICMEKKAILTHTRVLG